MPSRSAALSGLPTQRNRARRSSSATSARLPDRLHPQALLDRAAARRRGDSGGGRMRARRVALHGEPGGDAGAAVAEDARVHFHRAHLPRRGDVPALRGFLLAGAARRARGPVPRRPGGAFLRRVCADLCVRGAADAPARRLFPLLSCHTRRHRRRRGAHLPDLRRPRERGMIGAVWRGERPLWELFWLWYLLGGAIVAAACLAGAFFVLLR